MADEFGFKINHAAVRRLLTSDEAHDFTLKQANMVCAEVNRWADDMKRSGQHKNDRGPHFEVHTQPSKNRARYVVAPRTGFGFWLTRAKPLEFMTLLEAGRG